MRVRPQVPQVEAATWGQVSRAAGGYRGGHTKHIRMVGGQLRWWRLRTIKIWFSGASCWGSSASQQKGWRWLCWQCSQAGEDILWRGGSAQVDAAVWLSLRPGGADGDKRNGWLSGYKLWLAALDGFLLHVQINPYFCNVHLGFPCLFICYILFFFIFVCFYQF